MLNFPGSKKLILIIFSSYLITFIGGEVFKCPHSTIFSMSPLRTLVLKPLADGGFIILGSFCGSHKSYGYSYEKIHAYTQTTLDDIPLGLLIHWVQPWIPHQKILRLTTPVLESLLPEPISNPTTKNCRTNYSRSLIANLVGIFNR